MKFTEGGTTNMAENTRTTGPHIHVQLPHGMDAASYAERYREALEPDLSPYGFHLASTVWGLDVSFSVDRLESAPQRWFRKSFIKLFGFDIFHALHNRKAISKSDAIWTMMESEWLSVGALVALGLVPPVIIVGNSVWLFENWNKLGFLRRFLFRILARKVSALTAHSWPNSITGSEALSLKVGLMYFGISSKMFSPSQHEPKPGRQPIRIVSLGNDKTRDWPTLINAFGSDPRFEVEIACTWLDESTFDMHKNIRCVRLKSIQDSLNLQIHADFIVIPMVENAYSGITSALEAACLGIPIICSNTGGVPTYFDDTEVIFVSPGDPEGMRDAAVSFVGRKDGMAAFASDRFSRFDYSTVGMVRRYIDITEKCLIETMCCTNADRIP